MPPSVVAVAVAGAAATASMVAIAKTIRIAAGMFIQSIHNMGLVTLTHTPSPMGFLREVLDRPQHEEAMLVMPVGYPAKDAEVPDIGRKSLDEVAVFFDEPV